MKCSGSDVGARRCWVETGRCKEEGKFLGVSWGTEEVGVGLGAWVPPSPSIKQSQGLMKVTVILASVSLSLK